jgi:ATP-dependent helicase HrpB
VAVAPYYNRQVPPRLPIDPYVAEIVARVRESRAAIVVAPPGAGKTTRVPPALSADGPLILLQPRRIAARSLARRIAEEQRWTLGREVGWHVRLERRFGDETRVLVATEGILTARLQRDPLLSGFRTIVLDEFHERGIHGDVGLALSKQAWAARDDLRLVVMSATIDADAVAAYLGGCHVVNVPGRAYPLDITYRPDGDLSAAAGDMVRRTAGQILCFLPGAPEIRRAAPEVAAAAGPDVEVVPLHGALDAAEQDRAIGERAGRRVILATNIAETSLTVPGVSAVVDTGLHKVARYDAARGIDSLETERVTRDAADQRAGRAGRLGPGLVVRLWREADRLRPHREPEIHRIDLSGPCLDVLAWGGDPRTVEWFEPPAVAALEAGLDLLSRLGATAGGRLTPMGRRMHQLPLHPRVARIMIEGGGSRAIALACALLSERHFLPPRTAATSSDLLAAVEHESTLPPHVLRTAAELARAGVQVAGSGDRARERSAKTDEAEFRRALFAGYADRVGRRRSPGSPRVLLATGHGAVVGAESGVHDGEFVVALDVQAGRRGDVSEARIRLASVVEREWLTPTASRVEHAMADGRVRAFHREHYGAIVIKERPAEPDPEAAAALIAEAFATRGLSASDARLVRRLRFAGIGIDVPSLVRQAAFGRRSLDEVDLGGALAWEARQELERAAPERLTVPSGRAHPIEYHEDGSVSAEVKLQELFGLAETPRIGPRREPVLFVLLAPNGRAVQTTRDLRSFWERTYPEVRKELRGRYPKHPWPEDPWTAPPTARTTRGMKRP